MDIKNLPKGEFKIIIKDDCFGICDKNRNVIYTETSEGYWEKSEYDLDGNITYFENSDGYWSKREYDSNGNMIYLENSIGEKYFYDSEGNRYTEQQWKERKQSCDGKIILIEGKQYQLKAI